MYFGMCNRISRFLVQRHLSWLGHLAWMEDSCLPKQLLFEEFLIVAPRHGPKLHWLCGMFYEWGCMLLIGMEWLRID